MMTLHSPRMVVVKKEEKESKLRDLLARAVAPGANTPVPAILRLLAQSCASPVVRAMLTLEADLAAVGIETRVILAKTDDLTHFERATHVRVLGDVRCHDAHEMLALGSSAAWIGDSMRREPATRDSFELHTEICPETAARVINSFDKLWAHALACQAPCGELATELEFATGLARLPAEPASAPQVLTRH